MLGQPTVLSSWTAYVQGLENAVNKRIMTIGILVDEVLVRTVVVDQANGVLNPAFPGGYYVRTEFTPLIVSPPQRVAVKWLGSGADTEPLATVGFLQ